MKKYRFSLLFVFAALAFTSCSTPKKLAEKNIDEYDNQVGIIWSRPVDLPNLEPGKVVLIEANKPDGTPILLFCRDQKLLDSLYAAEWVTNVYNPGTEIYGYGYTIDDLKGESYTSEEVINKSTEFSDQQKALLIRYRNFRKYEMHNDLGQMTGTAVFVNNAFPPVLNGVPSSNIRVRNTTISNSTDTPVRTRTPARRQKRNTNTNTNVNDGSGYRRG